MPSTIFTTMRANIAGMQRLDPRTYEAMRLMIDEMEDLFFQVNPLVEAATKVPTFAPPPSPLSLRYNLLYTSVQFNWDSTGAHNYELRLGTVWETALFVFRTPSLSGNVPPLPEGTYTFLLKSMSTVGVYSEGSASVVVTINGPQGVQPTAEVVDNNVLLRWQPAVSEFYIDYYIIEREGTLLGLIYGTFVTTLELTAGTVVYTVTPVDIAGNRGSSNSVQATVTAPSDFVLEAVWTSLLIGTVNQVYRMPNVRLLACADIETWAEHFTSRGWTNIQDQVNAGYPVYAQPMELVGSYEETHDFGVLVNDTVISITWSQRQIVPYVNCVSSLSYSSDGITFVPYQVTNTMFAPAIRYIKFKLDFSTIDRRMLAEFFNFVISLSVKRDMDSGRANVFAAHVGGTEVLFNKAFRDVESITLTSEGVADRNAIYDFVDVPDPTGFKILLFSTSGVRVDGIVSWKARGIV
jgi:hypothetical protein